MGFLLETFLGCTLYVLVCIVIIGYLLYVTIYRYRKTSPPSAHSRSLVIGQIAALGLLYNFYQFLVVAILSQHITIEFKLTAYCKFGMDVLIITGLLLCNRKVLWEPLTTFRGKRAALDGCILLVGFLVGLFAFLKFPYVRDCPQLIVTQHFWHGDQHAIFCCFGALGYSALLYFSSLILEGIPMVTSGAGLKPYLGLLFALAILSIVDRSTFLTNRSLSKVLYFILNLGGIICHFGLVFMGKDTIFGILFSLIFISTLFTDDCLDDPLPAALFMAVSVTLSVITVPYLFLITFMYLICRVDNEKIFRFVNYVIPVAGIPLILVVSIQGRIPVIWLLAAFVAAYAITTLLRRRCASVSIPAGGIPYFTLSVFALALLASYMLMPVRLHFEDIVGSDGISTAMLFPPLDGRMTFWGYLKSYYTYSVLMPIIGLSGAVIILASKRFSTFPGVRVFALFPFVATTIVLMLAHSDQSVFTSFNLWDLIKDLPNWYGSFFFGFLALVTMDTVVIAASRLGLPRTAVFVLCSILLSLAVLVNNADLRRAFSVDFTMRYGKGIAHAEEEIVGISNHLLSSYRRYDLAVMPGSPTVHRCRYDFGHYGVRHTVILAKDTLDQQLEKLLEHQPFLLVANNNQMIDLLDRAQRLQLRLERIEFFPSTGNSLFKVDRSGTFQFSGKMDAVVKMVDSVESTKVGFSFPRSLPKLEVDISLPIVFLAGPVGLHELERHPFPQVNLNQPYDFCWAKRSVVTEFFTSSRSTMRMEFSLIPRLQDGNVVTVLLDGATLRTVSLNTDHGRFIKPVSIVATIGPGKHELRLEARDVLSAVPNDSREIEFGVLTPIRLCAASVASE